MLPPLNISLANSQPFMHASARSKREAVLYLIEYIATRCRIVSSDNGVPFKKKTQHECNGYSFHLYTSKMIKEASAHTAFGIEKTERSYEYLIFLFKTEITGDLPEIFILSTKRAFWAVHGYCQKNFPARIYHSFRDAIIKIERITTEQFYGSSSRSELFLREPLSIEIEQRGLVQREIVTRVAPFSIFDGSDLRVKFGKSRVVIYKKLPLEKMAKVMEDLHERLLSTEEINSFPKDQLHPASTEIVKKLEQEASHYVHDRCLTHYYEIVKQDIPGFSIPSNRKKPEGELTLSNALLSKGEEFKLLVTIYKDRQWGSCSFFINFPDHHSPPTFDVVTKTIIECRDYAWFVRDQNYLPIRIAQGDIEIHLREGEYWRIIPLLDSLEGYIQHEGTTYYKLEGGWFSCTQSYEEEIKTALEEILHDENVVLNQELPEALSSEWNMEERGEEDYNRSYVDDAWWFDGNRKLLFSCEMGDIIFQGEGCTYFYHVKKGFGSSMRAAAGQLIISAQVLRSLRDNRTDRENQKLREYCQKISSNESEELFNSLVSQKRSIAFVLALPVKGDDQVQKLLSSRSLIAKRELIRLKEGVEKLGFQFKISLIPVMQKSNC